MNFRTDINGLRAFAVAAVVLFHFEIPYLQGGFIGVDAFFVISGFLMTGIIYRRLGQDTFSLSEFYLDRARRILPALCVMCLTLLVVGWMVLFPSDYKELGKYTLSAVTFLSNFAFFRDTGYFDSAPTEKWLLHTWSLSVEWQFYLLYPLLLLALRRWSRWASVRYWLAAIGVASFLLSVLISKNSPAAAFYLLPTRAWEMIAGGLVFLYPLVLSPGARAVTEGTGLALITGGCLLLAPIDVWPGWLAAVPVLGTAMVIAAANPGSYITGNRVVQFIGRASYSIYLWHWPLIVGLHILGRNQQPMWITATIVMSVLLGWLSMRYVENAVGRPTEQISRSGIANRRWVFPAIPVAIGVIGLSIFLLKGVPWSLRSINEGERSKFIESYAEMHRNGLQKIYRAECDFYDWDRKKPKATISPACTDTDSEPSLFIWGDSHAQAISEGIRNLLPGHVDVAQVATSGCAPAVGRDRTPAPIQNNCEGSNAYALSEIARLRPATVVIAQRRQHEAADWERVADQLRGLGVNNVILLGPLPSWKPSLPSIFARVHWFDRPSYVSNGLESEPFATDKILGRRLAASTKLTYVSLVGKLCRDNSCLGVIPGTDGRLMALDYAHLTADGSRYTANVALRALLCASHGPCAAPQLLSETRDHAAR